MNDVEKRYKERMRESEEFRGRRLVGIDPERSRGRRTVGK